MMTPTYYEYLRDRIEGAPPASAAQLEQLIHAERNALWQQMMANPAYDERTRMSALSAFDEAATRIFSDQSRRLAGRGASPVSPVFDVDPREPFPPEANEPTLIRRYLRDLLILLVGIGIGIAVSSFVGEPLSRMFAGAGPVMPLGVTGLTPTQKSFKFVRSGASALDGKLTVDYASGTPSDTYACEVETTYRQVLEYVNIDKTCQTVDFKFLPLSDLWANFNYLQGYMVFTTTIMSPAGEKWQGSASVYFSIDGAA